MSDDLSLEEQVAPVTSQESTSNPARSQQSSTAKIFQASGEKPTVRWKNRRRMAWVALLAILLFTLLLWFLVPVPRITVLTEPIVWFYITMLGIIFAYIGFTSIPFFGKGARSVSFDEKDL